MEPVVSSDQLIARAIEIAHEGRRKTVAVAAAQDADVIEAVTSAQADGYIDGILVGDESKIRALADEHGNNLERLTVINEPDVTKAAHKAVSLASEGKADLIMKGFLPTSALLKVVLDRQYNLRGHNTLSHCAVLDIPGYHKMLNFTDGGMVVKPDSAQKMQVLDNAMLVATALGLIPTRVAVTRFADKDDFMDQARKQFPEATIEGPLTLYQATVMDKGAGADIFLVDSIEEGNIVAKALINFAEAVFSGVIVGARVPVSLVSRTDTVKNKKSSLAIACLIADYYTQNNVWGEA